jgi:hypothetical protein
MSLKTVLSYLSEARANLSEAEKSLERAAKLFERVVNEVPDVIRDYVDDVERLEIEKELIEVWEKAKIAHRLAFDAHFLILGKERDLREILDRSENVQSVRSVREN